MKLRQVIQPDFLIIGAQKCGTTWLWEMLNQHPGTDLRLTKEIQFFSSSGNLAEGLDWYYGHFARLDASRVVGEASTDYFHDTVLIDNVTPDLKCPPIPKIIVSELPNVKILLLLRDPVKRAVSAYYHHMQRRRYRPGLGLIEADRRYPYLRIIERGYYVRYLRVWLDHIPKDRLRCLVFEEDVVEKPIETATSVYQFLGLDTSFVPQQVSTARNPRWGWSHVWLNYYLGAWYGFLYRQLRETRASNLVERLAFVKPPLVSRKDIDVLRNAYSEDHVKLEDLLGRDLSKWTYSL